MKCSLILNSSNPLRHCDGTTASDDRCPSLYLETLQRLCRKYLGILYPAEGPVWVSGMAGYSLQSLGELLEHLDVNESGRTTPGSVNDFGTKPTTNMVGGLGGTGFSQRYLR